MKVTKEKSYNEQVTEENERRMKGISDILSPKTEGKGVLNSAGVEITTENMKVLNHFLSELEEAKNSGNIELLIEKAEKLRAGMKFVGIDRAIVDDKVADLIGGGFGIELSPDSTEMLELTKQRLDEANGMVSNAIARLNVS